MSFKEAEYTFRINKPFVPLIMESDYMPDGWLGIILGARIYINFKKYSFKEAADRLLREINSVASICNTVKVNVSQTQSVIPNKLDHDISNLTNVANWTKDDVKNWLETSQINQEIVKILKDFDGEILKLFNQVKNESPEYFYQVISSKNKIDVLSVLIFIKEFNKIFK